MTEEESSDGSPEGDRAASQPSWVGREISRDAQSRFTSRAECDFGVGKVELVGVDQLVTDEGALFGALPQRRADEAGRPAACDVADCCLARAAPMHPVLVSAPSNRQTLPAAHTLAAKRLLQPCLIRSGKGLHNNQRRDHLESLLLLLHLLPSQSSGCSRHSLDIGITSTSTPRLEQASLLAIMAAAMPPESARIRPGQYSRQHSAFSGSSDPQSGKENEPLSPQPHSSGEGPSHVTIQGSPHRYRSEVSPARHIARGYRARVALQAEFVVQPHQKGSA